MFIYFDLETTGHPGSPHITHDKHRIVQACFLAEDQDILNVLVHPEMHIPQASTAIHRVQDDPTRPSWKTAWATILQWIESKQNKRRSRSYHDTVYLVAHNGQYFDQPVLVKECRRVQVDLPPWIKFVDTLPYFKQHYPERSLQPPATRPYNLGNLYHDLLGKELEGAHDASVDVRGLAELIAWTGVPFSAAACATRRFLPDTSSVVDIKWIGVTRATRMENFLLCQRYRSSGYKTIGDVRRFFRFHSNAALEQFLREQLGIQTDGEILSILKEIRCVSDLDYPCLECTLPRSACLSDDVDKLVANNLRCASDLSYLYHSVCDAQDAAFRTWLTTRAKVSSYCCTHLLRFVQKMS